jgi:hypothetical protein
MQSYKHDPTEGANVSFDFTLKLAGSETITSVTSITQLDATANGPTTDLTIGAGAISGAVVTALVSGGVAGKVYLLRCKVATSLSEGPVQSVLLSLN